MLASGPEAWQGMDFKCGSIRVNTYKSTNKKGEYQNLSN